MNWIIFLIIRIICLIVLFLILHIWENAEYLHILGGRIIGVPTESMKIEGNWLSKDYHLHIKAITGWRISFIKLFPYIIGYPTFFILIKVFFYQDTFLPNLVSSALILVLTIMYLIMIKCEFAIKRR